MQFQNFLSPHPQFRTFKCTSRESRLSLKVFIPRYGLIQTHPSPSANASTVNSIRKSKIYIFTVYILQITKGQFWTSEHPKKRSNQRGNNHG